MDARLMVDVPFDSREAWSSFQLIHGMSHQTAYERLLAQNQVPFYLPLFDFPRENNAIYLLDHWQAHKSNARYLGLTVPFDLSTVDFKDQSQYSDWLNYHANVHANENAALGIQ